MSNRKLTVLLAPVSYVGPMMSSIGMAEVLRDSGGHRCVFAVTGDWMDRLEAMGFETRLAEKPTDSTAEDNAKLATDSAESNVKDVQTFLDNISVVDKALGVIPFFHELFVKCEAETEPYMRDILADIKPDVIISDHIITLPSIVTSGIPWIFSWSNAPLSLDCGHHDDALPPSYLGLPTNSSTEVIEKYRKLLDDEKQKHYFKYNARIVANGLPALKSWQLYTPSPFANIYMTAKELDYTDIRPLPETYHRFDYFKRSGSLDTFEIPDKLREKAGKLCYLSLGSMGSGNVPLMKRLVAMLAKSRHRYIVSKGVNHSKYELADNMWGQRTVPQIKVLPLIDLMLTHGGNNTVTETMYFGKPMIVMPLFGDQYDNAQRVQEMGYGLRLDPYECTEHELLRSIDSVLSDTSIADKCMKTSKRMQTEKSIEKLVNLVESLAK